MKHLRTQLLLFLSILLAASACNQQSQEERLSDDDKEISSNRRYSDEFRNFQLTDEHIKNFISLAKEVGVDKNNFYASPEVSLALEKHLSKYGFKDMDELVTVHLKIVSGVMLMIFEEVGQKIDIDDQGRKSFSDLEKEIEENEFSEEMKDVFGQMIDKGKGAKNWSEMMDSLRQVADAYLSAEDLEVLRRHYSLLKKEIKHFIPTSK